MKRNKKKILGFLILMIPIPLFWIIDWYWVVPIYNLIFTYEAIVNYIGYKKTDKVKFKYPLYAVILLCLFLGIIGSFILYFTSDFMTIPEKNIERSDNLWGNELNEDVRRVLRYDEESSVFFKIKTNDGEYIKVIGYRHTLLDVIEEWDKDDEEWHSEADLAGEMDERIDGFLLTKDGFRYTEQDIYRLFEIEGCHDLGYGGYSSDYWSKIDNDYDYVVAYKKWEAYKNKFPLISSKSQFEIILEESIDQLLGKEPNSDPKAADVEAKSNYDTSDNNERNANDDDDDDDEITDKYGKSSVYSLKCKEVVKMLESGDYIFRVTYVTQCYEGYFQLKDDVDVKIMNDPIKYAELPDDLLVPAEEYFGKQDNKEVININKPWFKDDPYILQETFVGEIIDGVNSLEYLINGLKNFIKEKKIEGSEDVTFSDYIDAQYDHVEGWWYQDGSLFERVRDYKIGFKDIRIFNKDGFRYYDFDDVISYLLIDEDMLEHDDYYNRIDFFIQPA